MGKLFEIDSPINGKLEVYKDLVWGASIKANGLTQSGGLIKDIWRKPLKKIKTSTLPISNCLILGLGGGTLVQLITNLWPSAQITGLDIDPLIVNLGKKYLKLDESKVKIIIGDAFTFLPKKNKFDLVCVDTYQGDTFPEKFESTEFLEAVLESLSPNGFVVFNRLYYGDKRPMAMRFLKKLEKVFPEVNVVYPQANIMFICK